MKRPTVDPVCDCSAAARAMVLERSAAVVERCQTWLLIALKLLDVGGRPSTLS
jgi:hypothetical protein